MPRSLASHARSAASTSGPPRFRRSRSRMRQQNFRAPTTSASPQSVPTKRSVLEYGISLLTLSSQSMSGCLSRSSMTPSSMGHSKFLMKSTSAAPHSGPSDLPWRATQSSRTFLHSAWSSSVRLVNSMAPKRLALDASMESTSQPRERQVRSSWSSTASALRFHGALGVVSSSVVAGLSDLARSSAHSASFSTESLFALKSCRACLRCSSLTHGRNSTNWIVAKETVFAIVSSCSSSDRSRTSSQSWYRGSFDSLHVSETCSKKLYWPSLPRPRPVNLAFFGSLRSSSFRPQITWSLGFFRLGPTFLMRTPTT
mmetsp:Transcript_65634/g.203196  ORF Transcript_65634/g.203196 Transcript_65634/m.203196 type:complete len:313 (+) Transcript_65634:1288-2226(+)